MEIIYKTKRNLKDAKSILFGLKGLSTYDNLVTLKQLEIYKDKNIYLALDKNIFNEDLSLLEEVLTKIDNYNIKGIIFYDLAVLSISKRLGIKTPLIWGQNFLVTNYKTCDFYEKQNVKKAIVSAEITIDEIEEIAKNTNLELLVNVFGYRLMAISKRKLVTNYFDYLDEKNDKKINYIIEKNDKYPIIENDIGTKIYTKDVLCGIRYLKRLKEAGVKYIILEDTFLKDDEFDKVRKVFETVINKDLNEEELLKEENKIKEIIPNISLLFLNKKTIYKVKR